MDKILLEKILEMGIPIEIKNLLIIFFFVLVLIDFWSGTKYQPIRKILQIIGRSLTKDSLDEIVKIKEELRDHVQSQDESEARRLRASIISFANSCRRGKSHTLDQYENVMRDYDDYLKLCIKHKLKNGYAESEFNFIKKYYEKECLSTRKETQNETIIKNEK